MMLMLIEWVGIFQGDANTAENSDDARNILQTAKVQNLKAKRYKLSQNFEAKSKRRISKRRSPWAEGATCCACCACEAAGKAGQAEDPPHLPAPQTPFTDFSSRQISSVSPLVLFSSI